jgi:hypothetical protein
MCFFGLRFAEDIASIGSVRNGLYAVLSFGTLLARQKKQQ